MAIIVIIGYLLTFFTHYNLRSDDLNVYVPYIENLIKGGRMGAQYDSQLYYWVLSGYINLFYRIFPNTSLLPMGLLVVSTSFVLFMLIYFTFKWLKKWTQQNHLHLPWLYLLVILYTILQFWYIVYPSYGNTFRRLNVVWTLLIIAYYYKKPTFKTIFLLSFSLLTLINFSSTGLFLNIFILYALAHVFAYTQETDLWQKLWILSLPFSLWMTLFNFSFIYIIGPFHLIMMILLLTQKFDHFNRLWIKYHTYLLIIVPIFFTLSAYFLPTIFASYKPWINFFTNPEFEMLIHYLRWDFSSLKSSLSSLTNILFWVFLFTALTQIPKLENRQIQSILYLILVMFISFFNPFVARFVISNFTQLAYFRIYDIFFNPFTLYLYFWIVLSMIKKQPLKSIVSILIVIAFSMGIYTSDVWPYLDFSGNNDPLHHVDKSQIEVFNQLEAYVTKEQLQEPINIIVQIHGAHLLTELSLNRQTSQRIDNIDTLFKKTDTDSKLNQIFMIKDSNEILFTPPYKETCILTKSIDTQFVIVEAQYNWDVEHELGYCAEKIFEVGSYRVFRMRYEWLN